MAPGGDFAWEEPDLAVLTLEVFRPTRAVESLSICLLPCLQKSEKSNLEWFSLLATFLSIPPKRIFNTEIPWLVVQLADSTLRTRVAHLADQNAYLLDVSRASEGAVQTEIGDAQNPLSVKKPGVTGRKWRHVTVDAGHGGRDRGAQLQEGLYEKDVVLAIARKLRWVLQSRLGVTAELSRSEDQSLSLDERAAVANRLQSDLLISLHIGNWNSPRESTSFAYIAKMRGTGKLLGGGEELDVVDRAQTLFLPWNRCQSLFLGRSSELAGMIQTELNRGLNGGDTSLSYRQAPLRLLSSVAMPAVLVEIGNASQADFKTTVVDPQFQNNVAAAIFAAVEKFRAASERR
jgi:N-acetylmuramoyl-L-alanine amidase